MAGSIDLYETRNMLRVLEVTHVAGDFLLSTFISGTEVHDTETIDIDIVKNGKKMAPFVSPVREGVIVTKEGYTTRSYKIPYVKMKTPTTAQEALNRRAGVTMYNGQTAQQYSMQEMGKILKSLDNMIFRREEFMAAECLQTGKVTVKGEGVDYVVDYGMDASHLPVLTGTDVWDNAAATIQDDLEDWANKVYYDSGLNATDAIIGLDASRAMLANDSFIGALDRRRIDRGEINVDRLPKGVKYLGYDSGSGLNLWTYTEQYFDDVSQTYKPLIDPKKVIVLANGCRFERHYGLIQNIETNFMGPRYPDNWITKDPSKHWVSLESAPLVALHEVDAVICAQVLA